MRFKKAEFLGSAANPSQYPRHRLPEAALAGRSNVGKSSLVNALTTGAGPARVAKQPGKTRTLNFYRMDDDVVLVDLPGYGYAKAPKAVRAAWGPMIEGYLQGRRELALVLLLVDARHGPTSDDLTMWRWMLEAPVARRAVASKWDKLSRNERSVRLREIREALGEEPLPFSAKTGEGREALFHLLRGLRA